MRLWLRVIGAILLATSLALPLGTCAEGALLGASDYWLSLESPFTWLSRAWPPLVLPPLLLATSRLSRLATRGFELVAMLYTLVSLSPGLLFGKPASGFFVALAGLAIYALGVAQGVPPPLRRAA